MGDGSHDDLRSSAAPLQEAGAPRPPKRVRDAPAGVAQLVPQKVTVSASVKFETAAPPTESRCHAW